MSNRRDRRRKGGKVNLNATNLVWFRDDLRVADHPALDAAMAAGPTVAVFILDEQSPGIRPLGGAARWWLHHALNDLRAEPGPARCPAGPASRCGGEHPARSSSPPVAREAVYWNRRYGGPERAVDTRVKELVRASGGTALSFSGTLLQEPWVPLTQDRKPFKVFTPFFNALLRLPLRPALGEPARQEPTGFPSVPSDELADWDLLPTAPDWSPGLAAAWAPGEGPARERLELVLAEIAANYGDTRDRPDMDGTSAALAGPALGPPEPGPGVGIPQRAHP